MTLRGAFTALITPFRNGHVDTAALRRLVERQIEAGIDGLVPCGTTGESATMTPQERLEVIRTVAHTADRRVPVVAGTGSNDTAKSVGFTRKVADIAGVTAALVVVPYYNKPNQEGLFRHFSTVADDGGLPVVLYNVPGRTALSLEADTVGRLAEHENIVAIKEATGDMELASRILEAAGERLHLLSGDDFTTYPLLACGGVGCVSVVSNLDPAAMSTMCGASLAGDWAAGRQLHAQIQPLARALFSAPNPVPTKTMASMLGWCKSEVRAPLYPVSDDRKAELKAVLDDYGLEE